MQLFALIQRVFDPFATAVIKRILITVAGAASKFARAFDGALQANLPMVGCASGRMGPVGQNGGEGSDQMLAVGAARRTGM